MTVSQTSRESRATPSKSSANGDLIQLDTPVVSLHVHRPHMPKMPRMPGMSRQSTPRGQEMNMAMETARTFLPPPDRLLYYGGLGLLAALGMIEWPIAVVVGAGTIVAARASKQRQGDMAERGQMSRSRTQSKTDSEPAAPRTTRARTATTSTRARATTPSTRSTRTSTRSTSRTGTAAQRSTGGAQSSSA
ncbi:hypothetical protein [Sphaerisporangium dianthi]|uniref:Uncharacterized protein n=1 Tax=Sphaerisporangium dianthi TaxID=1436120 RepID=A0ABV9CNJ9_9ACTN